MKERYLGQEETCVLCLGVFLAENGNHINHDHIFPRAAIKAHPLILKPWAYEDELNLARLCKKEHDVIDRSKLKIFRQKGLLGLVDYIGNQYPRARDSRLLDLQRCQWIELFTRVRDRLFSLNGETPPKFLSDYSKSGDLADKLLVKWEKGDF